MTGVQTCALPICFPVTIGVDTALLYDKRKIELVDSEAISFIYEGVNEEQDEYYDTTRDVLFCKLKYNDKLLNVFVAHLPSKNLALTLVM